MKKFIGLLKWMRQEAGISQNQLAMICGFSAAYISKLEAGKYSTITLSTLLVLGKAFEPEHLNPNMPRVAQAFFDCFMEE